MTFSRHKEFRLRNVIVFPGINSLLVGGKRQVLRPASMRVLLALAEHAPDTVANTDLSRDAFGHSPQGMVELSSALDELMQHLDALIEPASDETTRLTVEPDTDGIRFLETDSGPIHVEPLDGPDEGDFLLQTRDGPVRLHPLPQGQRHGLAGWFDELRRRRVFRSMAAYAVIAWLILQIVDVLSGALPVPDWTLTMAVIILATGFPLVAILSWFYQIGSVPAPPGDRGGRGDIDIDRSRLIHHIDVVIIIVLLGVVGFLSWGRIFPHLALDDVVTVAVLPFDNLSADESDRYLGDGIADDIRSRLDEIPQLLIAARRSSRSLAAQDLDIREVGERLGVDHIVEGSLRRAGGRIRLNLQLVDVSTGFSRWQRIYDTDFDEVLPLQNRVSLVIASELRVALTAELRELLAHNETNDPVAYDLYLRANGFLDRPRSSENLAQALVLFREAVTQDPSFALGYAGLCRTNVARFQHSGDTVYVDEAENDCNQALALDDNLSEVHTALGELNLLGGRYDGAERWFYAAIERDARATDAYAGLGEVHVNRKQIDEAEKFFQSAIELRPGNWNGYSKYAHFLLRQGRLDAAIENYRRAIELAPENAHGYNNLGVIYYMQGRFDKAAESYRQSLELDPGRAAYSNTGTMHYFAGQYAEAVSMFRRAAEQTASDYRLWGNLADAQRFVDDPGEVAADSYRRAIGLAKRQLEVNPNDAETLTNVAWYYANLGEEEAARAALEDAAGQSAADANQAYITALVYVLLESYDEARASLEQAKSLGFPMTIIEATPDLSETPLSKQ